MDGDQVPTSSFGPWVIKKSRVDTDREIGYKMGKVDTTATEGLDVKTSRMCLPKIGPNRLHLTSV